MKIFFRVSQGLLVILLFSNLITGCSTTANKTTPANTSEEQKMVATGSISVSGKSYALIVSGTWGNGILKFKGKKYRIKAKSIGAGYAVGVKDINIQGIVYNLFNLSDFSGNYYGTGAGATLGKGYSASSLTSAKKVTISFKTRSTGPAVDAGAGFKSYTIKLVSKIPVK